MKPKIIFWNTIFLTYIAIVCLGAALFLGYQTFFSTWSKGIPMVARVAVTAAGGIPCLLLFCGFLIGALWPPRRWIYKYRLIWIVISVLAVYALPFNIIFLIRWAKPEVKAYYDSLPQAQQT